MPGESLAGGRRRLSSPLAAEEAILGLLFAGVLPDQISRLADLRIRVQRGAYGAGLDRAAPAEPPAPRRLEFARWLVQTGRLRDS